MRQKTILHHKYIFWIWISKQIFRFLDIKNRTQGFLELNPRSQNLKDPLGFSKNRTALGGGRELSVYEQQRRRAAAVGGAALVQHII